MKMKNLSFVFLLILLFEITISAESKNVALLKYVLEWPPTFCLQLTEEEGSCKEPIPQDLFTLHGLMTADAEGFNIEYCPYDTNINWDKLFEPIRDELITFWPSLRENYNETEFWKHQWDAHGSCGGTTPQEYFYKAIAINFMPERGNLFNYLRRKGILPSDSAYPKQYIVEAIQSIFEEFPSLLRQRRPTTHPSPSHNIYLSCLPYNPELNIYLLNEVTLCTNLAGTDYISCPLQADPASCPDNARIRLPLPNESYLPLMNKGKKPMEYMSSI